MLIGDKALDSDGLLYDLAERRIEAVIPRGKTERFSGPLTGMSIGNGTGSRTSSPK